MIAPDYVEFDDGEYSKLRRSLIQKSSRGKDLQRNFLEKVQVTRDFLEYIKAKVPLHGSTDLEPLADQMSEAEFKDPPWDTEQRLFSAWHQLTPRIACRTTFWARVTFRHIEKGRIESSFLAANGGTQPGGKTRIDEALGASGTKATKLIDSCVRAVLRRLGGLPEARGNRTVYVNCPLARAWWRERLVVTATADNHDMCKAVRNATRVNQEYWENLVTFVVSRNSVFGSPEVRNIFVRTLGAELSTNPKSSLRNASELRRACRTLSTIQASRELSVMSTAEVERIMRELIDLHVSDAKKRRALDNASP